MELHKYIKDISYRNALVSSLEFERSIEERPLWEMLEKKPPEASLRWVGRFSPLECLAAEWSLAMVVEAAFNVRVPRRGAMIRAVLAELERISWAYRYIAKIFHVCGDLHRGEKAMTIVESVTDHLELLTGSRILHQAVCVGGVIRDFSIGDIGKIMDLCRRVKQQSKDLMKDLVCEIFVLHRWNQGLIIDEEYFQEIGVSGPIAQASGVAWDIRRLKPYFPYTKLAVEAYRPDPEDLRNRSAGRHRHRFQSVVFQARQSVGLIEEILENLPEGRHREKATIPTAWPEGDISSVVEAPSGAMRCSLLNRKVTLSSYSSRLSPQLEELLCGLDCDDFPLAFYSLGFDFAQGAAG